MPNHLAGSTSPYLLQHADNPFDWGEWGEEASAEARRRDVPLLISIGYAACHWCHVMAHESFEDAATAAQMNEGFVCVKVDREERPDVDSVYMTATQAMTGQGGWPMTVFTTPEGKPFYCGTYFPPRPVHGMPAFRQVLAAVSDAWANRRADLEAAGTKIVNALSSPLDLGESVPLSERVLDRAAAGLADTYDQRFGGFGGAPKFPPSMVLEFLLRHSARTGDGDALHMARGTLDAMARGGIYDQLAGGFARYSVDARWVVPHFEKMLYDNALLLRVYVHLWRATGDEWARRVADETAAFLVRDLGIPEGGFASALDADAEGVEGLTYAWTPGQLVEVLGPDDGRWAAAQFEVTERGTFEHGTSTLQRLHEPDDPARLASVRDRLLAARAQRPQPARDDKVVTAWNGLAIAALAEHGVLTGTDESVVAARRAAELLATTPSVDGRPARGGGRGAAGGGGGVGGPPRRGARGLRRSRRGAAGPSPGDRGGALAGVGRRPARGGGRAVRRRRRLARHRRRRRGHGAPAFRPRGRTHARGDRRYRRCGGGPCGAVRFATAPGARRGRTGVPGPSGGAGPAGCRVGRRDGGGAAGRAPGGGRHWSGRPGAGRARRGGPGRDQPGRGGRRRGAECAWGSAPRGPAARGRATGGLRLPRVRLLRAGDRGVRPERSDEPFLTRHGEITV